MISLTVRIPLSALRPRYEEGVSVTVNDPQGTEHPFSPSFPRGEIVFDVAAHAHTFESQGDKLVSYEPGEYALTNPRIILR